MNQNNGSLSQYEQEVVDMFNRINTPEFKEMSTQLIASFYEAQMLAYSKHSLTYKLGRYTGKAYKKMKRAETKAAFLIANWAVETFTFTVTIYALLVLGSSVSATLLLAFYLYTTYALFSMMINQKA